jgi:hypothetical protein
LAEDNFTIQNQLLNKKAILNREKTIFLIEKLVVYTVIYWILEVEIILLK